QFPVPKNPVSCFIIIIKEDSVHCIKGLNKSVSRHINKLTFQLTQLFISFPFFFFFFSLQELLIFCS
uniref:Uncharacterized protein n=1 Tax=Zonotrichia albicollis TaxID=44394 RepID=A0A8D2M777_ZONAL